MGNGTVIADKAETKNNSVATPEAGTKKKHLDSVGNQNINNGIEAEDMSQVENNVKDKSFTTTGNSIKGQKAIISIFAMLFLIASLVYISKPDTESNTTSTSNTTTFEDPQNTYDRAMREADENIQRLRSKSSCIKYARQFENIAYGPGSEYDRLSGVRRVESNAQRKGCLHGWN